jgi:hypothetical protein
MSLNWFTATRRNRRSDPAHLAASDQPQAWARLWRALKRGGVVYASDKLGDDAQTAEWVDALGRPFTDATEVRVAIWQISVSFRRCMLPGRSCRSRKPTE